MIFDVSFLIYRICCVSYLLMPHVLFLASLPSLGTNPDFSRLPLKKVPRSVAVFSDSSSVPKGVPLP